MPGLLDHEESGGSNLWPTDSCGLGGSKWLSAPPAGSKWVQAQPAGSKWQSALPTGSR